MDGEYIDLIGLNAAKKKTLIFFCVQRKRNNEMELIFTFNMFTIFFFVYLKEYSKNDFKIYHEIMNHRLKKFLNEIRSGASINEK